MFKLGYPVLGGAHGGSDLDLGALHRLADFPKGDFADEFAPASFAEQATGSWTSPATGITYGSGWQVTVPGGHLTVTPDLPDQELDLLSTQGVAYWEGDVSIQGKIDGSPVHGVGYTEINPPAGS